MGGELVVGYLVFGTAAAVEELGHEIFPGGALAFPPAFALADVPV